MNTRISSAIETSVYVLATVMTPRYSSRSIFFPPSFKANPAPEEPERGPALTEIGTQYPGLVYSEVNTPLTIDASGISNPPNRPRDDPWRWLQLQRGLGRTGDYSKGSSRSHAQQGWSE